MQRLVALAGVLVAYAYADETVLGDECDAEDAECGLRLLQRRGSKGSKSSRAIPQQPCLCLFDTDRTLTAIQDHQYNPPYDTIQFPKSGVEHVDPTCDGSSNQPLSHDSAYPHNFSGPNLTLRLSEFFVNYKSSFCGKYCYSGILSVGSIGGQKVTNDYKEGYFRMVNTLQFHFDDVDEDRQLPCSDPKKTFKGKECSIHALEALEAGPEDMKPFVINIGDACYKKNPALGHYSGTCKVDFVQNVTAYYKHHAGVEIPDESVYFFDDACVNVAGFRGSKYHAHQISCAKRQCWKEPEDGFSPDNNLGVCGATSAEVESALTGPLNYLCTVGTDGECDAAYGC